MSGKKSIKSMTAYGRAALASSLGHFSVELHTVNRRHLEIHCQVPSEFLCFDPEIRKWVSSVISRGKVTIKLSVLFGEATPYTLKPNLVLAKQLNETWGAIAQALGTFGEKGFKLEMLKDIKDLIHMESNPQVQEGFLAALKDAFKIALHHLNAMKEKEGAYLQRDIKERIQKIRESVKEIILLAPEAPKRFKEKLQERMQEFLAASSDNDERIVRELCLLAEKVDIIEEIVRLQSHLEQFDGLLDHPNESVGKTMEFLVQEMNREINTIGSKSSELRISQAVIVAKTELERIREQIQNIE